VQFRAIDVDRIPAEGVRGGIEIDDLGELLHQKPRERRQKLGEHGPHGVVREVHEPRPREKLHDRPGQIAREGVGFENALLFHFDLLAQFLANPLEALAHGRRLDPGVLGHPLGAPSSVVVALAEAPLVGLERKERARELSELIGSPHLLVVVEHGRTVAVTQR